MREIRALSVVALSISLCTAGARPAHAQMTTVVERRP
jgi:hypothetical protein